MKGILKWSKVFMVCFLVVALFSLGGCGDDTATDDDVTLVVWAWEAAKGTLEAGMEGFHDEYPNIKVEWVIYSPQDVYVNLPMALTAGVGAPDICLIENSHLAQMVELGGLLDITKQFQPFIGDVNQYKLLEAEKDGRYYAVPQDSGPVAMYYRRDVFEQAGLPSDPEAVQELVSTWEKYYEVAKTINEKTGFYMQSNHKANNSGRFFEMLLWQQGLGYIDQQGKVAIDHPKAIETLEFIGNMTFEGLFSDELEWTEGWYAELASLDEPVASIIAASWMDVFMRDWITPGTSGKWGVVRMPAWEEGGARASNDGGSSLAITQQSKNPEAAWAFIEYVLLRRESQINQFVASGFTPSLETAYDSEVFQQGLEFYNGQVVGALFNEIVQEIPQAWIYTPEYNEMNSLTVVELAKYFTGMQTAEEALVNAANSIRAATGRK
jgi:lactose/L-arabinose transport system substrate-binding protein